MNRVKNFLLAVKHRNFLDSDLSIYNKFLHKKSVFVHIPKTAGRSIINSIYGHDLKIVVIELIFSINTCSQKKDLRICILSHLLEIHTQDYFLHIIF